MLDFFSLKEIVFSFSIRQQTLSGRLRQRIRTAKDRKAILCRPRSSRQTDTPALTAALNNIATALGAHTLAETVSLFAPMVVRLKSSFHRSKTPPPYKMTHIVVDYIPTRRQVSSNFHRAPVDKSRFCRAKSAKTVDNSAQFC